MVQFIAVAVTKYSVKPVLLLNVILLETETVSKCNQQIDRLSGSWTTKIAASLISGKAGNSPDFGKTVYYWTTEGNSPISWQRYGFTACNGTTGFQNMKCLKKE